GQIVLEEMQDDVGGKHQHRGEYRPGVEAEAGERADGGAAPHRGGGVEAADRRALVEDHAGAEKADAGHDLAGDTRRAGSIAGERAGDDEGRRTERDQRARVQSRRMLAQRALEADQRAEQERKEKPEYVGGIRSRPFAPEVHLSLQLRARPGIPPYAFAA